MNFYDAHVHFYFRFSPEELNRVFDRLVESGMAGFNALVFAEFPEERETTLQMIPEVYHDNISLESLETQKDPFPYFAGADRLAITAFADARFIDRDMEEKVKRFRQQGFRGLKLLYVPEDDPFIHVRGMEAAFGRSVKRSEEVTARLIGSAASEGMCVLLHADLRRYGIFVEEMIRSFPRTHFNIPHFGSSRKAIARLLQRYPNCYTDISSLVPFMEKEQEAYRSFIGQYQDKILFGSDALIGDLDRIKTYHRFVDQFLDDREIFHKLVNRNYRNFHGLIDEA
jgi:hypothetical protein